MPVEISLLAAFLVGLSGGVHCVGMCGGIVGALSFGTPESVRGSPWRFLPWLFAYNGGRLLSYTVAGAVMGALGLMAANLIALHEAQRVLLVVAGLFMVALGLYLGGWWMGLTRVEHAGAGIWRRLEPLGRRFVPVRSPGHAFALGLVWGWLPCGLVYTALIWALSAGGPLQGALLLLAFGLGTLPNLLAMGLVAGRVASFTRHPAVRAGAGLLVILFGGLTLWRAW
ncbi:MAG TPA: sulfite exporter TauE/SafE family protein [Geothrix sp.]|nr:sulfite exporter TauE/SafE family protein [Geothrix sp.]